MIKFFRHIRQKHIKYNLCAKNRKAHKLNVFLHKVCKSTLTNQLYVFYIFYVSVKKGSNWPNRVLRLTTKNAQDDVQGKI